jgi:hypothetical protein
MRKKRKSRKAQITYQQFIFEINDWVPNYSFGVNNSKYFEGLYSDHAELELRTTCIFPTVRAGERTVIRVVGERDIHNPEYLKYNSDWKPNGVGTLEMRGERREYYGNLPYDVIWGLSAALAAEQVRYVLLYGPSLKRGTTRTQSIEFQRDVNLDNY